MKRFLLFSLSLITSCTLAFAQAYTEEELNARIDAICNAPDIFSQEQISKFLKSKYFSESIYKSNIGYPTEDSYVKRLFPVDNCTSSELQGFKSFLKKYINGKNKFSQKEQAGYLAVIRNHAREIALAESQKREQDYQRWLKDEEQRKKQEAIDAMYAAKNDKCLTDYFLNFIKTLEANSRVDWTIQIFNTLREWELDPNQIYLYKDWDVYNSTESSIEIYSTDFKKRNPQVETLKSSTDFQFDNVNSFCEFIKSFLENDLAKVVAGYEVFTETDYYRLFKLSSSVTIYNRFTDLLSVIRDRETRTDNHTEEWENSIAGVNSIDHYKIDYAYKDGIFVPEGNFLIHTKKYQNYEHTGDNFIGHTYDVIYKGVINDGVLIELMVSGDIKNWEKDYSVAHKKNILSDIDRVNNASAIVKNQVTVNSIEDVVKNSHLALEAFLYLCKDRGSDALKSINMFSSDPKKFMCEYLSGKISKDYDYPEKIKRPYLNNVDTSKFY